MIYVAAVNLTHELSAATTRRKDRPVAQDSYDSPYALFTVGYHGRNCAMFGTESDTAACVNRDSHMKIAPIGEQCTAHVSDDKAVCNLPRVDDRLSLLN